MTDSKVDAAVYKFNELSTGAYEIQPYTTTGVAAIYINWYKGIGNDNPVNGNVTLGLWTDNGTKDKASTNGGDASRVHRGIFQKPRPTRIMPCSYAK